ncbi:MAG TPA: DUF6647 family protein [Burkholderiales bacterium]|jgi:hypothetical protein
MQTLLTAIVTWLSFNSALPATYDHPRIERVPQAQMIAMRLHAESPGSPGSVANGLGQTGDSGSGHDLVALYDNRSRTIYLREDWTGATPAELSVLVHEMVHHLQNVAALKYDCAEAREKPAYDAQKKWLALFGRNLEKEFTLDAFTLLLRTNCMR